MKSVFVLLCVFCCLGKAVAQEEICGEDLQEVFETSRDEMDLAIIQTIAIINQGDSLEEFGEKEGVLSKILSKEQKKKLACEFLGQPISEMMLQELEKKILCFLAEQGRYAASVFFPDQEVSFGLLVLEIIDPCAHSVRASENSWNEENDEMDLVIIQTIAIINQGDSLEEFGEKEGVLSKILSKEQKKKLACEFLGQPILEMMLQELEKWVLCFLAERGRYAASVFFPDQEVTSGLLVLEIIDPCVHSVSVSGNSWNSDVFYENQFGFRVDEPLNTSALLDRVAWSNRNPFQYTEIVLAPSSKREVTIDLLVKDRFPVRPFAGADNTGTNTTNEVRLFVGANWGKPFWRSDLLTYQYVSAPNPKQFYAHSGSYLIFLPWQHELLFFGGYSAAHPKIPDFFQEGRSVQASLRYTIPFQPLYNIRQSSVSTGLDYKNFNSNVFFIEADPTVPIITHQANILQLYLSYAFQDRLFFKAELLVSPASLLPNQNQQRYQALRPHSHVEYAYGRIALGDVYGKEKRVCFAWTLRGQAATGPLLPSEQFSLGGYDTVRGYEERDFLADNAFCANAELRTFMTSPSRKMGAITPLLFCDYGLGGNYQSEQQSQRFQYLWSTGAGVRYQLSHYLTIRADYGIQLHHIFNQNAFGRFHLAGSLSY